MPVQRAPDASEIILSLCGSFVHDLAFSLDESGSFLSFWDFLIDSDVFSGILESMAAPALRYTCPTHPNEFRRFSGRLCGVVHPWQVSLAFLTCFQAFSSRSHCHARVCVDVLHAWAARAIRFICT